MGAENCVSCGAPLPEGARYCTTCGALTPDAEAQGGGQTTPPGQPVYGAPPYGQGQQGYGQPPYGYGQPPYAYERSSQYAGFWRRFAALIIDSFILGAASSILQYGILGAALGLTGVADAFSSWVPSLVIGWLYWSLMESSSLQATVGKMALGIVVTDLDGRRISFGRATGRYFAKYISAFILFIGYLMAGFTEKKQALHDMIAGTLVVTKDRY